MTSKDLLLGQTLENYKFVQIKATPFRLVGFSAILRYFQLHFEETITLTKVEDPQLEEITDPSLYPTVIHGTYAKCFGSIKKNGLSKMNRTHIHFAPGEFGREGVISGMRASAEIYIYVNLEKALNGKTQRLLSRPYFTI